MVLIPVVGKKKGCSNRTFMELKFRYKVMAKHLLLRSNRTFMELKLLERLSQRIILQF